jgi:hypothetical protein
MTGTVDFKHDVRNDIVICTPHATMETEDDFQEMFEQFDNYFRHFYRKMDVVFVFDDMRITGEMIGVWSEYRQRLAQKHIRYARRVNPTTMVNIASTLCSAKAKNKTPNGSFKSIEEAIAAIKADRVNAGIR